MARGKFYITTAIDYVNSLPHIGTAYEKIGADVLARWKRFCGFDVHFQMGNDEHSVNVWKAAKEKDLSPKQYCDEMRLKFEDVWKQLDISYDGFIQTSDPHHEKGVQRLFQHIMKKGDIYKSRYEGWYCESCEAFLTDKDLVDGVCPNHKSKPKWLSEENYFFALSKYRDKLTKHIKDNPEFILPDIRRNEILKLLGEGLQDVSISRSSFDWGIKLPNDDKHIIYVWFDALINYITAVGYGWDEKLFKKWWPSEMHVIGKDITRFHCVIWPAMLMSAGIALPKTVFGHGFITIGGEKMSKTLGNVVTPSDIMKRVGTDIGGDVLRYYLMREGGFGRDGDFTWGHFIARYNGDLANGLGNLVARTHGMAMRYQDGRINTPKKKNPDSELATKTTSLAANVHDCLDHTRGEVEFHNALASIWEVVAAADRHINTHKPWEMAKAGKKDEINDILWDVASSLFVICPLLYPFLPKTAERIWREMGFESYGKISGRTIADAKKLWGTLNKPVELKVAENLFPRIEDEKAAPIEKPKEVQIEKTKAEKREAPVETNLIDIQDFAMADLRIAKVTAAEKVEGADKLLKLIIDLGYEQRQIVAGIALHYSPEELIGKNIVVVANLKPAKLRGIESNGMLLAATDENTISILTPLRDVAAGSKVK
jgi:methionyl-tRNA synthetase